MFHYLCCDLDLGCYSFEQIDKNVKCHFLSFSPTPNASTWTATKNEVYKELTFKPMLTVSNCLLSGKCSINSNAHVCHMSQLGAGPLTRFDLENW